MKALRSIPGLFGRHYEKVILALALLALIGAVVWLNEQKSTENDKLEKYDQQVRRPKVKMLPQVDVSMLSAAMQHATNPPTLNFSHPHNLVNPVKWVVVGLLLFDGCRDRRRLVLGLASILSLYFLIGLQVIRAILPGIPEDGISLSASAP